MGGANNCSIEMPLSSPPSPRGEGRRGEGRGKERGPQ